MRPTISNLKSHKRFLLLAALMSTATGLFAQSTQTFNNNGKIYSVHAHTEATATTWIVPPNVSTVTIKAWGGGGGHGGEDCGDGCGNAPAGHVGYLEATYAVSPGDTLGIYPGGKGGNGQSSITDSGGGAGGSSPYSSGFDGGNGGDTGPSGISGAGGGGGAASVVTLNSSIIAVAGGAGGGGGMANAANSAQPGSASSLANGTSNHGGDGAPGNSCGKADGGGAGGGGGGAYGSQGGTTYAASAEECAGYGGFRGASSSIGASSLISNLNVNWNAAGKVEIVFTPKDQYVDLDASDSGSYPGSGSTWTDLTVHHNDFALYGSPAFSSDFGGYLQFDGTGSQYAERIGFYGSDVFIGSSSSPENWNGNATYEAWVNPETLSTGDARLVFGDGNNNEGVIDFRSDRIIAWNSAGVSAEYVATINTDEWYHVAMTHERITGSNYEVNLFLNGSLVASGSGNTSDGYYGPDNNLRIGYNWDGGFAKAKVYNYLRSDTEISDDYEDEKHQYCHFQYTATAPGGSGTELDPYQIASFENLLWLSKESAYWDLDFVQTADIDAAVTSEECFQDGKGWSPIGTDAINFTGSYDGGGFAISNLFIDRSADRYIGFFGKTEGAIIKNLNLDGAITADWDAGALVGYAGGASGLIKNVNTNVTVNARESAGGLTGHNQGVIENCSSVGNVIGSETNFGGLVGYNKGGKIYRSFAAGDVSNSHSQKGQVGGLVGALLNTGAEIVDCYASGSVTAQANTDNGGAGGLVGRIRNTDPVVTNCYSYGAVSASGGPIGGLIGYNEEGTGSNVVASVWDNQTSGQASSAGGTAKTTAQMNDRSTFFSEGWDLQCEVLNGSDGYWGANSTDNSAYPFLSWQGFTDEPGVAAGAASSDQQLCMGNTPEDLTLSGYSGAIQWQSSLDGNSFTVEGGATSDVLDLQAFTVSEDLYFRAIVTKDGCSDTSNVVLIEAVTATSITLDVVACDDYLAPDGQSYSEDGQYIAIIPNANGCDSTITINLTMLASIEVSINVEACETYTAPDNSVYNTSGQYLATLPRANGCDSLITINLTINNPTSHTIYPVVCNSYVAPDGQVHTSSGIFTIDYTNSAGCDSTLTVDLTVNDNNTTASTEVTYATLGFANGAATVSVTGGQGPYTYQWNDSFMQTTETAWGVFTGWYTCTITDATDCEMQIQVYVPLFLDVPHIKVSDADCNSDHRELHEFVSCEPVQNADAYRWKFTEQGGSALPEFTRANSRYLRLQWVDGLEYGKTYDVCVKALVDGEWGDYSDTCTIALEGVLPTTEIRPEYHPTNALGQNYELCDFVIAYNAPGADNYRWRFDPDMDSNNGNELIYTRGSSNPGMRLSWLDGISPGSIYQVAIQARFDGNWSDFGATHQITMADVAQPELRATFCGKTYPLNSYVLSGSVCESDYYQFQFEALAGGTLHTVTSGNYVANFNNASPALSPGDYNVSVRVSQNGVLGEYGAACQITIGGLGMQIETMSQLRSLEAGLARLYPNPSTGGNVNLNLSNLPAGYYQVSIDVFDVFGQQISGESFGHQGERISRRLDLKGDLATGMYLVQIRIDEKMVATERLIIR